MNYNTMSIEFRLDGQQNCDEITSFYVDEKKLTKEVSDESVINLVKKLSNVGVKISDDPTDFEVYWENGKMDVVMKILIEPSYYDYDGPVWEGKRFEETFFENLEPIEFEWK